MWHNLICSFKRSLWYSGDGGARKTQIVEMVKARKTHQKLLQQCSSVGEQNEDRGAAGEPTYNDEGWKQVESTSIQTGKQGRRMTMGNGCGNEDLFWSRPKGGGVDLSRLETPEAYIQIYTGIYLEIILHTQRLLRQRVS